MKNGKGFTLIELLLVIAIIGILTTFLMANFLGAKARARDAQRKSDLRQLQSAFEQYRADQGQYPTAAQVSCGGSLTFNGATYMQKIPCDPLNNPQFKYTYVTNGPAFTTYTLIVCLENINDSQKDTSNNANYCTGGTTNWSYTLNNP
ncbi:MAG TPA: prepilin-type N-terminal cleavage/methylation domain-containing protein [Candidatus Sulfotelmatobacter sp.]|jgi:general secretion pathway protein G|nr:prepilin-type N-terminal cleavage/methylation domain-containing protein [Candidatus Sulfotelmatobacter sp.]